MKLLWPFVLLPFLLIYNLSSEKRISTGAVVPADTTWYYGKTDTILGINDNWAATLDIYAHRDSFEFLGVGGSLALKIVTVNAHKVAMAIDNDSLYLFKFDGKHFIPGSGPEELYGMDWTLRCIDMNYDGFIDIMASEVEGAHGNCYTTALLYDSKSNTLKHKAYLDLVNPVFNKEKRTVITQSYSSLCGTAEKSMYAVGIDSIELLQSVTINAHCEMDDRKRRDQVNFIKSKDGQLVEDSIFAKPKKAWAIYTGAF